MNKKIIINFIALSCCTHFAFASAVSEYEATVRNKDEIRSHIEQLKPSRCDCKTLDLSYLKTNVARLIEKVVSVNNSARSLNLANNDLSGDALANILKVLSFDVAIESLDLSGNDIGSGYNLLDPTGKYKIKALDLRDNKISNDEQLTVILKAFSTSKALEALGLSSVNKFDPAVNFAKVVAAFLKGYRSLTKLDVSGNRLASSGIVAIIDALQDYERPIDLDLAGNVIDARGMRAVARLLPKASIKKLSLWDTGITDEHLIALANVLPSTKIEELDLYLNDIGDKGVARLLEVLPKSKVKRVTLLNNSAIKNYKIIEKFGKDNPSVLIETGDI